MVSWLNRLRVLFAARDPRKQVYTNGTYDVLGLVTGNGKQARLKGVIVKSRYRSMYDLGDEVDFPVYHRPEYENPQFVPKRVFTLWDHLTDHAS